MTTDRISSRHLSLVGEDSASSSADLVIDCAECTMRDTDTCADCVVTYLSGPVSVSITSRPPTFADASAAPDRISNVVVLDEAEQAAVRLFADAGLAPTLRHRAAASA